MDRDNPPCPSLVCAVCHEIFQRPTSLRCGHTFCGDCIRAVFARERSCPCCRREYSVSYTLSPNLTVQQLIAELDDYCRRSDHEKDQMEASKRSLMAANQTLQTNLDMQQISLEESKASKSTLELRSTEALSKAEEELKQVRDENSRLEGTILSMQTTMDELRNSKESSSEDYKALEFSLREEIKELSSLSESRQRENCSLVDKVRQQAEEIERLQRQKQDFDQALEALQRANRVVHVGCGQLQRVSERRQRQSASSSSSTLLLGQQQERLQSCAAMSASFLSLSVLSSSSSPPPLEEHQRMIWAAIVFVWDALAKFPILLQNGGMSRGTSKHDDNDNGDAPSFQGRCEKVFHVLCSIWLLWILHAVCSEAFGTLI